jgi:hypothetical protein
MMDDAMQNQQKWRNIEINKNNMRTRAFRFKLIDYEEIVPSVIEQYA